MLSRINPPLIITSLLLCSNLISSKGLSILNNSVKNLTDFKNQEEYINYLGMNDKNLQRHFLVISGLKSIRSPRLIPTMAFGIEARNNTEHRHYAELCAKQEY